MSDFVQSYKLPPDLGNYNACPNCLKEWHETANSPTWRGESRPYTGARCSG